MAQLLQVNQFFLLVYLADFHDFYIFIMWEQVMLLSLSVEYVIYVD